MNSKNIDSGLVLSVVDVLAASPMQEYVDLQETQESFTHISLGFCEVSCTFFITRL